MCSTATSRSSTSFSASAASGMVILLGSSPARGAAGRGGCVEVCGSCLQVAIHEVDLLQAAETLADVLGADLADALDGLQLGVGGGQHLVQAAELVDDLLDDELRQPRDAPEDPVAARRDREIERV